jgi:hypothetical protein
MHFPRLPLVRLFPRQLRFGLRALLLAMLAASLALAVCFNLYLHYRGIYENEEAVLSFLASGAVSGYREEPPFNCTGCVLYHRKPDKYATRGESVPWYCDHSWSPVDRSYFQRTRCLVLPSASAKWSPQIDWHAFYQNVARLPELEYLKPGDYFTDDDLRLFKDHPKLRFLDLRRTQVTAEALESLAREFPRLNYLAVSEPTDSELQVKCDVGGVTVEDLKRFQPTPQYWEEVARRRQMAQREFQQRYENVFARLAARPSLALCVARRPPPFDPKTMPMHPEVSRFPWCDSMIVPAADRAVLARVRAEEPEAVFYDFRPEKPSEYTGEPMSRWELDL